MKPDRNAIVIVNQGDIATERPALFVYMTPDGFAWIEPGYLEDGAPPRQCFIRVAGKITAHASGFTMDGADGRQYAALPLEAMPDGENVDLKRVCAWATARLAERGATLEQERERLRIELAEDLG